MRNGRLYHILASKTSNVNTTHISTKTNQPYIFKPIKHSSQQTFKSKYMQRQLIHSKEKFVTIHMSRSREHHLTSQSVKTFSTESTFHLLTVKHSSGEVRQSFRFSTFSPKTNEVTFLTVSTVQFSSM